ncbi:uncharacterized protein [Eurosta solidaginis]
MISGIFFSSAWVIVSTTTQAVAIVFYGCFAGIGSSLFVWKTHVILEAVRPREDKFVRKTIYLCGEAFCQLFLSFVFTSLRTLYGTAQSIVLMSSLLVNLIPISLIITRHREGSITKRISLITADSAFPPLHHQLGAFPTSIADQIDGIEMQLPRTWKSPLREQHHGTATAALFAAAAVEARSNYMLAADESYVTFVNPNGVEIMEIIPEEEETLSVMRSSSTTIGKSHQSVATSQSKLPPNMSSNGLQQLDENVEVSSGGAYKKMGDGNWLKFRRMTRNFAIHIWKSLRDTIFLPLQHALMVPRLYSTTLLMSVDIFSYVMCLTVLPSLAVTHHAIKNAEIPFLFSLLAFPWMCFSLMTPRFGHSLYKRKIEWHTLGSVCKALALILISFSTSKLQLSVSSVLLGFGQSVTLFLQDVVYQRSMPRAQWNDIRHPVHFTNGLLICLWGALAHYVVVQFSFQATVGLAALLYVVGMVTWNMIFVCCNTRD